MKKVIKAAALALPFAFGAVQAKADVLELALLIDGSGSISPGDFALQQQGYVNVLNDNFWSTFGAPSIFDSVLIGVWEFAAGVDFLGEQLIDSDADAQALAAVIAPNTQNGGTTNTGGALNAANAWFANNSVTGRRTVDISTDGVPTTGPDAQVAADAVRADGGIVNAIGVGGVDSVFLTALTSPNGFFVEANNFGEFEETLRGKLEREITEVPAPGTLALLASSLLGFGALRRRRKA